MRKPATAVTADILSRGMEALESEEDLFFAKEASLPLVKILEVLHYGNPKDKEFLSLLAKAYGNYAFGFAEMEVLKNPPSPPFGKGGRGGFADDWHARAKRFYTKGKDYGIAALSRGEKSIADVPLDNLQKYLKKFGRQDVNSLFWTAFDWGSYINMSRDDITIASDLPRVEAIIDRVIEVLPDFQCGIAHAFKGALIAGNSLAMMGQENKDRAKKYFDDASAQCGGRFLMNRVMYAEWYLVAIGDHILFKKTLSDILASDAGALPRYRLANELAKERARLLLINSFAAE